MSLKDDLMYPFGNVYRDKLTSHQTKTALKNVLTVAKDRHWIGKGRPIDNDTHLDDVFTTSEDIIIQQSIQLVEELLSLANGEKEEHTQDT